MSFYYSFWLYFAYLAVWLFPGGKKFFLDAKKERAFTHYAVLSLPLFFVAEIFWRSNPWSVEHSVFAGVAIAVMPLFWKQANAGLGGKESGFGIFVACVLLVGSFGSFFFLQRLAEVWLACASIVATYLFLVEVEIGIRKQEAFFGWKDVVSLFSVGVGLVFLSQEIYPGKSFSLRSFGWIDVFGLLLPACLLETISRSSFQKKLIQDTFAMPGMAQIAFSSMIQIGFYHLQWGSEFIVQFAILSFFSALLFFLTENVAFSLLFSCVVLFAFSLALPFPPKE